MCTDQHQQRAPRNRGRGAERRARSQSGKGEVGSRDVTRGEIRDDGLKITNRNRRVVWNGGRGGAETAGETGDENYGEREWDLALEQQQVRG